MATSIAPAPVTTDTSAPDASGALSPVRIKQIRGADYPVTGDSHDVFCRYVDKMHAEDEVNALARYKQGLRNIFYANGRQHIGWQRNARVYDDLPLLPRETRVTMNHIRPMLRSRASRLMSSTINFTAIPESNSLEHRDQGRAAVNWLKWRMRDLRADHRIRHGLRLAFCTGVGALKTFWNPDIGTPKPLTKQFQVAQMGEDGQPVVVDGQVQSQWQELPVDGQGQPVDDVSQAYWYRPGDTDFAVRSIFNLRWNADATGFTPAEGLRWLTDSEIVPLSVAKERFPEIADKIRALTGNESFVQYERMAAASTTHRPTGVQVAAGQVSVQAQKAELCVIREYYEMPSPFYAKGRCIVIVGGACAYEGEFPLGFFPYDPLYDEVALLSGGGSPCVNDMISPQDVINEQWAAINKEMKNAGTGQFAAFNIPGVADQINNTDDSIIRVPINSYAMGKGIRDVIQRMDPAQVPSDRWRMLQEAKSTIYDIGAYHEISRGQIPPGLDSGVAIERLQESEAGQLKDASEALRQTVVGLGLNQIRCAKWGYGADEMRALPVDRPDLKYTIESVSGGSLPDPDRIGLELENFRPRSEAAFKAEVSEWMEKGAIDARTALQMVDMGRGLDAAFASSTRDYAKARTENLQIQRGLVTVVVTQPEIFPMGNLVSLETGEMLLYVDDDAHAIHIEVLGELSKDMTQPLQIRQIALIHAAEHRAAAMIQTAKMTPQPQPEGESAAGKEGQK